MVVDVVATVAVAVIVVLVKTHFSKLSCKEELSDLLLIEELWQIV